METLHTRAVFAFPPNDCFKKRVSWESQKGICFWPSVRALIHIPRVVRERLMFWASFNVWPVAPVFSILSDPARSTRFKTETFEEPSAYVCFKSMTKIVWDHEDLAFWLVPATALFIWPSFNSSKISSGLDTRQGSLFNTVILPFLSSLSFKFYLGGWVSKSLTFSL